MDNVLEVIDELPVCPTSLEVDKHLSSLLYPAGRQRNEESCRKGQRLCAKEDYESDKTKNHQPLLEETLDFAYVLRC